MATELYTIPALLDALCAAVDTARAATTDRRWLNAIDAGYDWLLQQDEITFDTAKHELTVPSPSGKTYTSNGACQCEAFAQHNACWHRASARLVRRALELAPVAWQCGCCGLTDQGLASTMQPAWCFRCVHTILTTGETPTPPATRIARAQAVAAELFA